MLHRYIDNPDFKSRFRILKGGKISLVVSALLVSGSLMTPVHAQEKIYNAVTGARTLDGSIDSLKVNISSITFGTDLTTLTVNKGLHSTQHILNNGLMKVHGAGETSVISIGVDATNDTNGIITNNDTITAISTDGKSTAILLQTDMKGAIVNNGNIDATGLTYVRGIFVDASSMAFGASITNSGTIGASSSGVTDHTVGIEVDTLSDSSIINEAGGVITATGGSASYGIKVNNFINFVGVSTLTNNGDITATNGTKEAYGVALAIDSAFAGTLNNTGTIKASNARTTSLVAAVYLEGLNGLNGTITNSGTIQALQNNLLNENAYSIFSQTGNGLVTNETTGKLYGNIAVKGNSVFNNKGLVSLPYNANTGNTPAQITNFTNQATATLEIGVGTTAGAKEWSQLLTTDAVFADGSTIAVNVLDSTTDALLLAGDILSDVVQTTNSLNIDGVLNVTDNSALVNFEYITDGSNIDLKVVSGSTILDSTIAGGGGSNDKSAATALQTIQAGTHPEMDQLFTELNKLGTDAQVAAAVDSTTPQTASASVGAATQISNGIAGIVEQRQQANIGGGLNSGDSAFSSKNVWGKTYGSIGQQKNKDGLNGFDVNTYGVGVGIDAEYKSNQNIGMALFYTRADVDVNNVAQTADMDVFTTLIYGNVPMLDTRTNFLYQLGYAFQQTDTSRTLFTGQTATADYTSKTASLDLKLMRDYEINKRVLLQPIVSTTYRHFDNPSYSETGAGANSLNVDALSSSEFLVGVGTLAHYKLDEKSKLTGNVKIDYDMVGDNKSVTSSFAGATGVTYGTEGIDNGRWQYEAGVGYDRDVKEGHNINLSYNYQGVGSGFTNHIVSARYMYSF